VKFVDEIVDWPSTVTVICPVVAPDGTAVTIDELVELVTTAIVPLNMTVLSVSVVAKPAPVMVTVVPEEPLVGEKLVIAGITIKLDADIADWPLTVTRIGPVVAPDGTVVLISVLVELVTVADVPLNVTALLAAVASKFVPTMVTVVPTVPPDGEKLVMLGAGLPQPDRISRGSKATMVIRCRDPYDVNMLSFLS
jgi:hypothetical protein